jgi:hypothetical protein
LDPNSLNTFPDRGILLNPDPDLCDSESNPAPDRDVQRKIFENISVEKLDQTALYIFILKPQGQKKLPAL